MPVDSSQVARFGFEFFKHLGMQVLEQGQQLDARAQPQAAGERRAEAPAGDGAKPAAAAPDRDRLADALDRLGGRLDAMDTRLDRLERSDAPRTEEAVDPAPETTVAPADPTPARPASSGRRRRRPGAHRPEPASTQRSITSTALDVGFTDTLEPDLSRDATLTEVNRPLVPARAPESTEDEDAPDTPDAAAIVTRLDEVLTRLDRLERRVDSLPSDLCARLDRLEQRLVEIRDRPTPAPAPHELAEGLRLLQAMVLALFACLSGNPERGGEGARPDLQLVILYTREILDTLPVIVDACATGAPVEGTGADPPAEPGASRH